MSINDSSSPEPWRFHRLDAGAWRRLDDLHAQSGSGLDEIAAGVSRELLELPEMRLLVEGSESLRQFQSRLARQMGEAMTASDPGLLVQRWREMGEAAHGLGLSIGFFVLAAQRLLSHALRVLPDRAEEVSALIFLALNILVTAHAQATQAADDEARRQSEGYALSLEDALVEREKRLLNVIPSDPLTGLLTQGRFQDELERILALSFRRREPFTMIHLQCQGLGQHLSRREKDEVLFLLAQTLRETFRKTDLLCHWSEGLFLVAMPNATEKQTVEITSRMIRSFTARERHGVTFVMGIAQTHPETPLSLEALMALAEETASLVISLSRENPGFYVRRASSLGGKG